MRRIVIDNARRKRRFERGGRRQRADAELAEIATAVPADDVLALDEALRQFAREEPRAAELVWNECAQHRSRTKLQTKCGTSCG